MFDAASVMTAIVNKLDNNSDTYNNVKQMHDSITTKIASINEMQKKIMTGRIFP